MCLEKKFDAELWKLAIFALDLVPPRRMKRESGENPGLSPQL